MEPSKHQFLVEGDVLHVTTHGGFTVEDVQRMFDGLEQVQSQHKRALLLIDTRGGVSMDGSVRRAISERSKKIAPHAIAVFGATLTQQALLTLINGAVQLVRGRPSPLRFCPGETEARAWLDGQRQKLG